MVQYLNDDDRVGIFFLRKTKRKKDSIISPNADCLLGEIVAFIEKGENIFKVKHNVPINARENRNEKKKKMRTTMDSYNRILGGETTRCIKRQWKTTVRVYRRVEGEHTRTYKLTLRPCPQRFLFSVHFYMKL